MDISVVPTPLLLQCYSHCAGSVAFATYEWINFLEMEFLGLQIHGFVFFQFRQIIPDCPPNRLDWFILPSAKVKCSLCEYMQNVGMCTRDHSFLGRRSQLL